MKASHLVFKPDLAEPAEIDVVIFVAQREGAAGSALAGPRVQPSSIYGGLCFTIQMPWSGFIPPTPSP